MVALFSFAVNLLVLAAPLYMIQVYDRVMASHSEITLLMLTIITMAAMIVMALLEFARSQVLVRVSTRLDRVMSPRMFQVAFEGAVKRPGASRQQPLGDFMNIRQFLTGNGVLAAFDAPWTPIFLLIMWAFHPLLGAITLAGAVILVGLTIASEFLTRRALAEAQAKNVVSSQLA
jgi:ABC-type protease/lipase transport system fused ATPase/permease subunit